MSPEQYNEGCKCGKVSLCCLSALIRATYNDKQQVCCLHRIESNVARSWLNDPKRAMNRLAIGKFIGTAREVANLVCWIEAEPPEKRGGEISRSDGIAVGVGTKFVARAEGDSSLDAAAGQDDAVTIGPVVAPGGGVDLGCPAELAHGDDQGFLEESATAQVVNQGRECLVGRWNQVVLEPAEHVLMGVPVGVLSVVLAVVNRDKPYAGFDQAASQENALPEFVTSIAVTQFWVFRAKVKRPTDGR